MEAEKETSIISEFFLQSFGVKQIIDSLLFLFLLTQFGGNFIEKCLNNETDRENLDLLRFFEK